jgi:hypothetical protein
MVSLASSAIVGVALVATVSTDALAKKKAAPAAVVAVAPAPVAVAVIGNYGPIADRVPRCFDSPILYPVPPCY